jgi:class 3 adenylate cyclase/tetratricopeptide (TPR) repeat protein
MQNSDSSATAAFSLDQAIQALEAQRAILGDDVVDAALGPLRAKLASMQKSGATQAPVSTVGQQRRILTILFADLSGFTAMAEGLDAEDVRDTMNALWQRLDNIIINNGGRIDKHLGDGVIALWGTDESREDDVERAIRAALMMQSELASFKPEISRAVGLKMRIGINTGPALYGQIGSRGEQTAMGDVVDLASKLEQTSQPGRIQISHDSYRHVRGVFDVEPFQELELRGKAEPMRTYLVKSAKPRAFRISSRGIEGVETRMVGRQTEFQLLTDAFEHSFHQKKLQTISVFGEAGIGKSRLIYELNTWAELQSIPWWWFKGRGSLSAMNSPYALLRDIFAFRFEISESDSLSVAHAKLEAGVRHIMPADEQAIEKAHVIGHLIGLNFSDSPHLRGLLQDPRQLRQQALFYLTQFFQAACDDSPVLVMLDDLQWADTGSLDALIYIVNNLPANTPFMILAGARPAFVERYPRWVQDLQPHTTLQLSALSKEDSRRLVEEILRKVRELPGAVRELVVGGAEGNPFYVEELIKMLIDARVIEPGSEEWKVDTSRLATVNIPTTLTEVLQARLDSLTPVERYTLQHASIVGRVFWDDAVLALSGNTSPEEVRLALAALCRKELVYERKPSSFVGIHEYTFKHTMLYEVTYDTLLKRQRTQQHIRVAAWLEQISGERRDEVLAQIAGHYELAGETLQAVNLLEKAGIRALALSALTEARGFLEHAAHLLDSMPEKSIQRQARLHLDISDACFQLGDYPAAQSSAEAAWKIAQEIESDSLSAAAQVQLGFIIMTLGNYDDARSYYLGALYLLESLTGDYRPTHARMLNGLATVEWRLGNLVEAESYARESYEIASEIHELRTELVSLNRLGAVVGDLGRVDEEEQCYQKILQLAREAGMREREAAALNNLGAVCGERKDWQGAWDYYMQALAISKDTGVMHSLALNYINLAFAGSYLGRNFDDVRDYLRQGISISRRLGIGPVTVAAVSYYGLMLLAQGQLERALALFGACRQASAFNSENEREIAIFLKDWDVPPDRAQAGMESGASLDWDTLLDELLA